MLVVANEEGRRTGHTTEVRALEVLRDAGRAAVPAQVPGEPLYVETESLRVADEGLEVQRVLMLEEHVVHRPERALSRGRLGGLRGALRQGMDIVQRQVPPHVAQVTEVGQELTKHGLRPAAVRALEVAVLEERHGSVAGAADVVPVRVDRHGQVHR